VTRLFITGRAVAAALLLAGLGGCELLKHNEEAQTIINGRVLGMAAGEFFDRYGRASGRSETADGGMSYDWISSVRYAPPGPEGLDDRVCKLRLTADRQGRISAVQVQYDAPGMKSTSRCGEIFAAK
jgi:hypothetical protein